MEQYNVEGMSCAACVAHVEKAVRSVEGVDDVTVNLLTNSMTVEGTAGEAAICEAVHKAGYSASKKVSDEGLQNFSNSSSDEFEDKETPKMLRRLSFSVLFLLPLMYLSMGHMLGWPLPEFLCTFPKALGLLEMLLCICIIIINRKFFISGFMGVLHGAPNMDTLVALGSGVSFLYSIYSLLKGSDLLYFESAAMILTLITVGKTLEAYSKGKTTNALKGLMDLAPKTAIVLEGEKEVTKPVAELSIGDIFLLRPGMSVPVDGVVIEGSSALNVSALTGESIPIDKSIGDEVVGGTINTFGFLKCKVTRTGSDTTLSKIIQMVSDASASKAPIAKIADKVAGAFVPVVLICSLITALLWIIFRGDVVFGIERAITVLVISCPCALGLATPVAIMVGTGVGARNGILYKNASALENAGRASIVVLDKTGTITTGNPTVTNVISDEDKKELLTAAYALEIKSDHPLAKAVCSYAKNAGVLLSDIADFEALPGNGLKGTINGAHYFGGKESYAASIVGKKALLDFEERNFVFNLLNEGKTPIFYTKEKELLGAIFVADELKPEAPEAIEELKEMGLSVVMLTGDNEKTASAIGEQAGVTEIISNVLPDEKDAAVQRLQEKGKVIMVGDGINDAPALTRADTGFAIGAGTDIAIDAADVVLVNSKLTDVPAAIRLSKNVILNIHENLFWAFIYNIIGIPLAAGIFLHDTGFALPPMFGAAAMSLSSFCVVMNALKLNLLKIKKEQKTKKSKEKTVTKELTINGMMCQNCEKHVRGALEKLNGVTAVKKVSHEENVAVIEVSSDISEEALKAAVTDAGYEFVSVK